MLQTSPVVHAGRVLKGRPSMHLATHPVLPSLLAFSSRLRHLDIVLADRPRERRCGVSTRCLRIPCGYLPRVCRLVWTFLVLEVKALFFPIVLVLISIFVWP